MGAGWDGQDTVVLVWTAGQDTRSIAMNKDWQCPQCGALMAQENRKQHFHYILWKEEFERERQEQERNTTFGFLAGGGRRGP
jgi:hypothetical protein